MLKIVKESSAVLMVPNEVRIGQNADHREIARFSSLQDRNFRPLLSRLKQFRDDIFDETKRQETRGESGQSVNKKSMNISPRRRNLINVLLVAEKSLAELPFPPCDTFRGRTDVLRKMEEFFGESLHEPLKQKRFTICGLGKSIALQMIFLLNKL